MSDVLAVDNVSLDIVLLHSARDAKTGCISPNVTYNEYFPAVARECVVSHHQNVEFV